MTDLELAEEIKWRAQTLREYAASTEYPSAPFCIDTAYYMEKILAALRRADLAQTEIKGHMRTIDNLKTENVALQAECNKHYGRLAGLLFSGALDKYTGGDVQAWATEYTEKLDEAQARIAELEKDAARLDYLEREMELEQQYLRDHPQWIELGRPPSLFRRNVPITRAAIDAALKDRA